MNSHLSSVIAIIILIIGVIAGFSDIRLPLRQMHLAIGIIFIVLVPVVIYVHLKRFYVKGPLDWIAWTHFILFSLILMISVKMIKRWYPQKIDNHQNHEHFNEKKITWNGNKIDRNKLEKFKEEHPGGAYHIQNILDEGGAVENHWENKGVVSKHKNKPRVLKKNT